MFPKLFLLRRVHTPGTATFKSSVVSVLSTYSNFTLLTNSVLRSLLGDDISKHILAIGDVDDLCSLEYKGYSVGPCLKSYVIDQTRTATPSLRQISRLALEAFQQQRGLLTV
jgi:hypothetical protein